MFELTPKTNGCILITTTKTKQNHNFIIRVFFFSTEQRMTEIKEFWWWLRSELVMPGYNGKLIFYSYGSIAELYSCHFGHILILLCCACKPGSRRINKRWLLYLRFLFISARLSWLLRHHCLIEWIYFFLASDISSKSDTVTC